MTTAAAATVGLIPVWAYEMVWILDISVAGYWPLVGALAVLSGAFVWVAGAARRWRPGLPLSLVVPIAWAGLEFLRGEVIFDGFPWLLVAHPTIDAPVLPHTAALLGTYFTSFLVAAFSGIAADLLWVRPRPVRAPLIASIALLASIGLGALPHIAVPSPPEGHLRVAVVQTNIPQDNKMDWEIEDRLAAFSRFLAITTAAATASPRPDLIVWPETMFPGEVLDPPSVDAQRRANLARRADLPGGPRQIALTAFADELRTFQRTLGIPLLVGAMATDNLRYSEHPEGGFLAEYDARYNSTFLIQDGEIQPVRYDKIDLTPFGEVMPYISNWDWLERQLLAIGASGMAFDLVRGRDLTRFEVRTAAGEVVRIVTPICFEATRQLHCRQLVNGRNAPPADLMINLTNDGWFGDFDPTRLQHLQIARWRCIELGLPMVRAANTGISAHIDARGRVVLAAVEPVNGRGGGTARVDGLLVTTVALGEGGTAFASVGGVFGWSAAAGVVVIIAAAASRWWRGSLPAAPLAPQ